MQPWASTDRTLIRFRVCVCFSKVISQVPQYQAIMASIPATMKAAVIYEHGGTFTIKDVPVPVPKSTEVRIFMYCFGSPSAFQVVCDCHAYLLTPFPNFYFHPCRFLSRSTAPGYAILTVIQTFAIVHTNLPFPRF